MMLISVLLLLQQVLSAAAVHTGFNYGAFWSTPDHPKGKQDFIWEFEMAKNLKTPVPFDTARLFTSIHPGTDFDYIEAFDAAVETQTKLLLGFYVAETRPAAREPGQPSYSAELMFHNELRALEKALTKYGSKLGDLIIGLSIGNEDMELFYAGRDTGVDEPIITGLVESARAVIGGAPFNDDKFPAIKKYMQGKPIGHTDTAPFAHRVKAGDFAGVNAYPYWSNVPPAAAKAGYFGAVEGVKAQLGKGMDIWLTEIGWPVSDEVSAVKGQGTASVENLQKFWNEVACEAIGKYNMFWFELVPDSAPGQPNWAVNSFMEPVIDMSCGKPPHQQRDVPPSTVSTAISSSVSVSSFPSTGLSTSVPKPSDVPSSQIYTGFSYGAFWSEAEPKFHKDFVHQFKLARSLPNVPVPFTSARLYQAAQWGTPTEPSEAFQAAIDTNTTLLIGLWMPIDNELIALDKAFAKHGQKLVDLVIGILVGNEDIYRGSDECTDKEGGPCRMTATPDEVTGNITRVKDWMEQKPWFKLFKAPPQIGHADTARNAAVKGADIVGANIFPYWHPAPIDNALEDFEESHAGVKDRAGEAPVWITETGWPSSADNDATATLESMQKYWSTLGCSLFGKQTTFWFELEKDTHDRGNLDWGLIDIPSQKPKFNLTCPQLPKPPVSPPPSVSPTSSATPSTSEGTETSTVVTEPSTSSPGIGTMSSTIVLTLSSSTAVETSSPSAIVPTLSSSSLLEPSPPSSVPEPSPNSSVVTTKSFSSVIQTASSTWEATHNIPPAPSLVPTRISIGEPKENPSSSSVRGRSTVLVTVTEYVTVWPSQNLTTTVSTTKDGIVTVTSYTTVDTTVHLTASSSAAVGTETPSCAIVSRDPNGQLITITANLSGLCPTSLPLLSSSEVAASSSLVISAPPGYGSSSATICAVPTASKTACRRKRRHAQRKVEVL